MLGSSYQGLRRVPLAQHDTENLGSQPSWAAQYPVPPKSPPPPRKLNYFRVLIARGLRGLLGRDLRTQPQSLGQWPSADFPLKLTVLRESKRGHVIAEMLRSAIRKNTQHEDANQPSGRIGEGSKPLITSTKLKHIGHLGNLFPPSPTASWISILSIPYTRSP